MDASSASKRRRLSHTDSKQSADVAAAFGAFRSLDGPSRQQFLAAVVDSLDQPELAELFTTVEAARHSRTIISSALADGFATLPAEILANVFARLWRIDDLRACSETCTSWHACVWATLRQVPWLPITGKWLPVVSARCPSLQILECQDVTPTTFLTIRSLSCLTVLDVDGPDVDRYGADAAINVGLDAVLPCLPLLTSLTVGAGCLIDGAALAAINGITTMRSLALRHSSMGGSITRFPSSLASLEVDTQYLSDEVFTGLPALTKLSLYQDSSPGFHVTSLLLLTSLRTLSCQNVMDHDLYGLLGRLSHLSRLVFRRSWTAENEFHCPTSLVVLKGVFPLRITNMVGLTAVRKLDVFHDDAATTNDMLRLLARLTTLENLGLLNHLAVNGDCGLLLPLQRLTRLYASWLPDESGISRLTQLRELHLSWSEKDNQERANEEQNIRAAIPHLMVTDF